MSGLPFGPFPLLKASSGGVSTQFCPHGFLPALCSECRATADPGKFATVRKRDKASLDKFSPSVSTAAFQARDSGDVLEEGGTSSCGSVSPAKTEDYLGPVHPGSGGDSKRPRATGSGGGGVRVNLEERLSGVHLAKVGTVKGGPVEEIGAAAGEGGGLGGGLGGDAGSVGGLGLSAVEIPPFEKGDLATYIRGDKTVVVVEILSVDSAHFPPSYMILVDGRELETEHHRLGILGVGGAGQIPAPPEGGLQSQRFGPSGVAQQGLGGGGGSGGGSSGGGGSGGSGSGSGGSGSGGGCGELGGGQGLGGGSSSGGKRGGGAGGDGGGGAGAVVDSTILKCPSCRKSQGVMPTHVCHHLVCQRCFFGVDTEDMLDRNHCGLKLRRCLLGGVEASQETFLEFGGSDGAGGKEDFSVGLLGQAGGGGLGGVEGVIEVEEDDELAAFFDGQMANLARNGAAQGGGAGGAARGGGVTAVDVGGADRAALGGLQQPPVVLAGLEQTQPGDFWMLKRGFEGSVQTAVDAVAGSLTDLEADIRYQCSILDGFAAMVQSLKGSAAVSTDAIPVASVDAVAEVLKPLSGNLVGDLKSSSLALSSSVGAFRERVGNIRIVLDSHRARMLVGVEWLNVKKSVSKLRQDGVAAGKHLDGLLACVDEFSRRIFILSVVVEPLQSSSLLGSKNKRVVSEWRGLSAATSQLYSGVRTNADKIHTKAHGLSSLVPKLLASLNELPMKSKPVAAGSSDTPIDI